MRKIILSGLMAACLVILGVFPAAASFTIDAKALGAIPLQVPENASEKKYLGLSGTGTFNLSQVQADTIIVEIFSMYCPICQAEAPNVNKLHRLIDNAPDLKARVKLIGIGTGNTPFEVDVFRKKYDIQFPLFPDDAFHIQKASSQPIRTPTFVSVERRNGNEITVRDIHLGRITDIEAFLKAMTGGN